MYYCCRLVLNKSIPEIYLILSIFKTQTKMSDIIKLMFDFGNTLNFVKFPCKKKKELATIDCTIAYPNENKGNKGN